jgi:hypothetical protein
LNFQQKGSVNVRLEGFMPNLTDQQLAEMAERDKSALRDFWTQVFETPPPPQLRRDLMVLILSYRIQEQAFGGLSKSTRSRLRQIARALDANPEAALIAAPNVKPGTRLVREWGNKVHVVEVEERGYRYGGAPYASLSKIARLITGAHWSGPLFFGLKDKQPELEHAQ